MNQKRLLSVWIAAAAAAAGCRSGAGPGARAPEAPAADFLASYVGQQRIVRGYGDGQQRTLKAKDLEKPAEGCDWAVEVKEAAFAGGVVRMRLEQIGEAAVVRGGKAAPHAARPCREWPRTLSLSGLAGARDAEAALRRVVQTPEAYLTAHGVSFDLLPVKNPGTAGDTDLGASDAERTLGRRMTSWPKLVLRVDPVATASPRQRVHYEGEVEFVGVVGPDGRLHNPSVTSSLSEEHEAQVMRALALWRFEPARTGSEVQSARVRERAVLRIL